jgi:heme/copper-type cytochrome/quinol oxidase subunit 2
MKEKIKQATSMIVATSAVVIMLYVIYLVHSELSTAPPQFWTAPTIVDLFVSSWFIFVGIILISFLSVIVVYDFFHNRRENINV